MKDIAIIYMVAGISTRFGGKIKQFAKVTETETLIEYSLNQALKAGFTKIIFIVGEKTEKPFKEKFGNEYKRIPIEYTLQYYDKEKRDKPWGTADALCSIKDIIDCPFVVCNGDDIYGEESFKILFNHLKENQDEATLGYKLINVIPDKGKTHRAIFQVKEDYVKNLEETFDIEKSKLKERNLAPESPSSMNIFALHPDTVSLLNQELKKFKEKNKEDRKIEFFLPNEISKLIKSKKIKMNLYSTNSKWTGITNPGDELIVREKISKITL